MVCSPAISCVLVLRGKSSRTKHLKLCSGMIDRSRTEKNVNTASSFIILPAAINQSPDLAVVILTLDTLQYYVQLVGTNL